MAVQLLDLSFEHHPDGFGIESRAPRLSWRFGQDQSAPAKGWHQTAYEVEIFRGSDSQATESYRVESEDSVLNPWPSRPLGSRERAAVRVRVFGTNNVDGHPSEPAATPWTDWHVVETGLLERSDWTANFITTLIPQPKDKPRRPMLFRKAFNLDSVPAGQRRARLYITSLGVYEAHIDGRRVGDLQMTPGWTSYNHRLPYQVYDVSPLLKEGENVLAAEVAEGWYAGRLVWGEGFRNCYGDTLGLLAQLEIQEDGKVVQSVISDGSWRARESALITSEIYDGEVYDAREDEPGWSSPGFHLGTPWNLAQLLPFPSTTLFLPDAPPVRVTQVLTPRSITTSATGTTILDFGQNLVGKIHIQSLTKPANHVLTIRHAEILQNNALYTRPLRAAAATDTITFSSAPLTNYSPRFTFHGFRYVELSGLDPSSSSTANITAQVLHTALPRTGHFRCSDPRINQLHTNAVWSFRGNSLSIPTDCPQRDERLGWTGDIQVFAPSASFLFRTTAFLANWLRDLAFDQRDAGGVVPMVVPDVLKGRTDWKVVPQAVWDDVAVLLPWEVWRGSGDKGVLAAQWESMVGHVEGAVRRGEDGLWDEGLWQLGDWLDPNAPPGEPGAGRTDGGLVADAYLVHVTGVMARVAGVLGKGEEEGRYREEWERLRGVFREKYVAPSGLVVGDSQTSLALAIAFDLYEGSERSEVQRKKAGERLVRLVKQAKYRVSTGFAGTPLVLHALSKTGHVQEAYRMLLEDGCPSWLYPVSMGATTVWERWDSMLPDGTVNPGEMTSFNHYALGSVVDWLHGVVAGLTPVEPGWKRFRVRPLPGGTITWAEAKFESQYGLVIVKWLLEEEGTKFRMGLQVPPNTEALVVMPGEAEEEGVWVGSGVHQLLSAYEAPGEWPPKDLWR
ncbi:hypothetical protein DBV05_g10200 [Lasiodiplodia theobromae]|uniref:alpha-L-rhamnosidase n=1 Tax=Lasiodiplodia theobromae TaxID=45133 RepID=A0A5N5D0G8_9PEZI|nr:hypothetical protein DBV05_g10200 [Lasiodiplodia theobromae]